ncbi:uncharacterized protein si:dkey-262k9.2 isoform X2 [Siniperca chuatsi]|nr:uncharacterized protein si:dkey-262k9.2 isoform X2 [Siniperca chuatsi]XP_044063568.1 uncharacterized protein si:dkey-262k9.2 isoform X2 [Siniperca chuatsi]XP_044063569.1 uncharacterized protein si:dkey-262k9.2 isoform X2 [Siniperca chuatsi]XP_044063570.1 uncharacterized protein si:dkey-262k9.2 isoform X2 [Siniperca chuatsi]
MMRLLFLCLLLLPAATAVSEDNEGSADGDSDDEDLNALVVITTDPPTDDIALIDKAKSVEDTADHFTLIVIVVAVTVLTLSVATISTIILVRRHMHNRQQGIYSVPTEQDQKVSV